MRVSIVCYPGKGYVLLNSGLHADPEIGFWPHFTCFNHSLATAGGGFIGAQQLKRNAAGDIDRFSMAVACAKGIVKG